ncbi:MAG: hypothetical protein RLZZ597_2035 [Cyanobacteriota bacterium]|jgi:hypothetical protein
MAIAIPQPWTLSLDRTNWSLGSVHFNILMLGIVHEGVALPLFWTMLDKQGNSDERIDLLEPQFGLDIVTRTPGSPHPQPLSSWERGARKTQRPSPLGLLSTHKSYLTSFPSSQPPKSPNSGGL